MGTTETKQVVFTPETMFTDKTVAIRYIITTKNGVTNKEHSLYGGLTNTAVIAIPAPINMDGKNRILEIFTKEELKVLAEALQNPDVENINSGFWKDYVLDTNGMPIGKFPIYLKKEGTLLQMKDPLDYIYHKVLLDSPLVAANKDEIPYNDSFRFYAIESDKVFEEKKDAINNKKKAYIEYGKLEGKRGLIVFILRSLGIQVDSLSAIDFLNNSLFDVMEEKTREFLALATDPLLPKKVVMEELVKHKLVLVKDDRYYSAEGSVALSLSGSVNDLDGACAYFDSALGQATYLKLTAAYKQIVEAKNKE